MSFWFFFRGDSCEIVGLGEKGDGGRNPQSKTTKNIRLAHYESVFSLNVINRVKIHTSAQNPTFQMSHFQPAYPEKHSSTSPYSAIVPSLWRTPRSSDITPSTSQPTLSVLHPCRPLQPCSCFVYFLSKTTKRPRPFVEKRTIQTREHPSLAIVVVFETLQISNIVA